ncbi:MAG: hypothetical protein M1814_003722 [Vezdaea aestivalis]|nr:MAG: hypothetical protein M1814_003722 [Vezdaea aestivalis]
MASSFNTLFSRGLACFYCGGRSHTVYVAGLRDWKCKKCDAVNYLDKKGNITDPPANLSNSNSDIQYAQAIPRPTSPISSPDDEPLFCRQCINNQTILTKTLADYFPPTTDPEYSRHEKAFPAYRKRLEREYPQVCAACEPRVLKRIKATGYAARTDHLRRIVERTKAGRSRKPIDWRHSVLLAGKVAWWASFGAQISWNAIGCLPRIDHFGLKLEAGYESIQTCAYTLFKEQAMEPECVSMSTFLADYGLLLGLLSIWWNSRLRERVNGEGGRMVGLSDYYKLQVISLSARCLAWFVLGGVGLTVEASRMTHAFFLVFFSLTTFVSSRTVKVDHTPLFVFPGPDDEKIHERASLRSRVSLRDAYQSPPESQVGRDNLFASHNFPINSLAKPTQEEIRPLYNPPTPPPEDDVDAMDWTPSQKELEIAPTKNIPSTLPGYKQIGPEPFNTRIPPAPKAPSARHHNPYGVVSASQAQANVNSKTPVRGFLKRLGAAAVSPPNLFQTRSGVAGKGIGLELAPKRLDIPLSTHLEDTGLESFFDDAFSLKDRMAELGGEDRARSTGFSGHGAVFVGIDRIDTINEILTVLLGLCWVAAPFRPLVEEAIRFSCLIFLLALSAIVTLARWSGNSRLPTWFLLGELSLSGTLVYAFKVYAGPVAHDLVRLSGLLLFVTAGIYTIIHRLSTQPLSPPPPRRKDPLKRDPAPPQKAGDIFNLPTPQPPPQSPQKPQPRYRQPAPPPSRLQQRPANQPVHQRRPSPPNLFSSLSLSESFNSRADPSSQSPGFPDERYTSWREHSPTRSEASVATTATSVGDWSRDPGVRKKTGGRTAGAGDSLFGGRTGLRSQSRHGVGL